jgi:competence protein ComFC
MLDLLYPPRCLSCGKFGAEYLCESCISQIESVPEPYCSICGHTLSGRTCFKCMGRAKAFTSARAVGVYSGTLRQAIHQFKYNGARMLADPLAGLLYKYLTTSCDYPWKRADCIIPVPIHPSRYRARGYNQSELLALKLSSLTGLPVLGNALVRTRCTRPQVELSAEARRINTKDAFTVANPHLVERKTAIIVDDVSTTSSTIYECSKALIKHGATRVYALCLAVDL